MKKRYDIIVIGQGLAGSCLAHFLHEEKKDVLVIDNSNYRSSSMVAAGMYNPVVFLKQTLSFNADQVVPFLKDFYTNLENQFDLKLFHPRAILKVFRSVEELNNWQIKAANLPHSVYMQKGVLKGNASIHSPLGLGQVYHSGHLDIPNFLNTIKQNLIKHSQLLESKVQSVCVNDGGYLIQTNTGQEIEVNTLIYCEGHLGLMNSFFNYLPLDSTKGDVLTIEAPELKLDDILNKGFFILPLGSGVFRVGATFNWKDKSYKPTEDAKKELMEKIRSVVNVPFKVLDQQAGLRPTVGDRRPLLGEHPKHKNMYIFNGLGSKGVMLAPYYAKQLTQHIFHNKSIDKEVDIKRYLKHYGNK